MSLCAVARARTPVCAGRRGSEAVCLLSGGLRLRPRSLCRAPVCLLWRAPKGAPKGPKLAVLLILGDNVDVLCSEISPPKAVDHLYP